jgi:transposase-like protein
MKNIQRSYNPGAAWENVTPFFAFPPEVRRVIYTTNMIESLHMQLRKIIKSAVTSSVTMPQSR